MPRLTHSNALQTVALGGGNFRFSAVRPESLGATEYTLVTLVVDVSSSVCEFKDDLLQAVKAVVNGCRYGAYADNLLVRLMTFDTDRREVHGFKPLGDIDPDGYAPFDPSGMTALFDATYDAVIATTRYAKLLVEQDFLVNGAVYVITDGCDNRSHIGPRHIAEELRDAYREELLESLITVLIGVNTTDGTVKQALKAFKDEAGLTQYVNVGDATPKKLARLAAFVSRSIASQSQVLGTGSAARTLTF